MDFYIPAYLILLRKLNMYLKSCIFCLVYIQIFNKCINSSSGHGLTLVYFNVKSYGEPALRKLINMIIIMI